LFNTILNRTPLTAETNREVIKEYLPNVYLPELIAQNGEDAVREILESHFISSKAQEILMRDLFTADDFEDFIAERQRTIQEAIESMLIKERLDLSPRLRELDQRVEQVELGLRQVIEQTLAGDPDALPSHVYQKATERVQHALKKNAALEADYYETLSGRAHTKLGGASQINHEFHELTRRKADKFVKFVQFVAKKHRAICTPPTCRYAPRARINFDDLQSRSGYRGLQAYAHSKLAIVLFTYELARRLEGTGVTANALHPGLVATGFGTKHGGLLGLVMRLFRPAFSTPEQGAQTSIYLATSPEVEGVTGKYFVGCKAVPSSPASYDPVTAHQLWQVSAAYTKLVQGKAPD